MYWKFRKVTQNIIFQIKKLIYHLFDKTTEFREYRSFGRRIVQISFVEIIKGALLSAVALEIDYLIMKKMDVGSVDGSIFVPFIIGGIGIAGVILGLFCSNIATIYSTRYVNAPVIISNAFHYDKLNRKCVSGIVDYITFGFIILSVMAMGRNIGWFVVAISAIFSVGVIVSYTIAGKRSYQLSDIYSIADDSNRVLYRVISKGLNKELFAADENFQNHFMESAEKQLEILRAVQKYGESESGRDNTTLTEFMGKNLAIVTLYWMEKRKISRLSMWFRDTPKYQKWHMTSDIESSLALRTGTLLRTKGEHDYWWFEEEIFSINRACVSSLVKKQDYASLYAYILGFDKICKWAIEGREANYYAGQVNLLKQAIEKSITEGMINEDKKELLAGLVEVISLIYLNIILETSNYYQKSNYESIAAQMLKAVDRGKDYAHCPVLRGRENKEYYDFIITEVKVEGKRITPDWVIKQQVAKEEYVYLNSLLDIVREGMDSAFNLGKVFLEKKLYFEACIIFSRFYEYESKLSKLIDIVISRRNELEEYHIDKALVWDAFRLDQLRETIDNWKKEVPELLYNGSCHFTLDNWNNSEKFPDYLGESYNHICEDAISAIINNDIEQFSVDYENLSKIMLLYQEYIRSDFIKKNNLYRAEYAYYMFTSPIAEWAQIGGLAIIWGEVKAEAEWKKRVCCGADSIFLKDGKMNDLPEKFVEYIQHRSDFMFNTGSRELLETQWKMEVENALRKSGECEQENSIFGLILKTDSNLLKSFCPRVLDFGFTNDPAEVFWVTCVNPNLPDNKRFKTRNSWDEEMKNV